jgi:hypothetical protein
MGARNWLRRRINRFLFPEDAPDAEAPIDSLREFVYLDETSFTNLAVSRSGALADQIVETASRGTEFEVNGTVGADVLGAKSEIGSRYQTTNSRGTQISRKVAIQGNFKSFLQKEASLMLISGDGSDQVAVEDLTRGELIEIEVELYADPIYRIGAALSEFADLAQDYPPFAKSPVLQYMPVNAVLQRALAGLIPIRGRLLDRHLVTLDNGSRSIVRTPEGEVVDVVAVTELSLYWRDIRRVLFSGSRYRMLCRMARSGIHDAWSPVKLADVFAEIAPDFGRQMSALSAGGQVRRGDLRNDPRVQALVGFGKLLAAAADVEFDEASIESQLATVDVALLEGPGLTAAMYALAEVLVPGSSMSAEQLHEFRTAARSAAGIDAFADAMATSDAIVSTSDVPLLDVEVIAIYW